MRIAITGATGFLGRALEPALVARGHEIVRVTRGAKDARPSDVTWEPGQGFIDTAALGRVDAGIHLAGESIGDRWNADRKRRIRDSRLKGTKLFAETLAAMSPRPSRFLSGSAIGIYGNRDDEVLDETSSHGKGFLAETGVEWERAAEPARAAGIRLILPRNGLVMAPHGGFLGKVLPLFRAGIGGRIGDGKQWLGWISLTDWVAAYAFLLEADVSGPVNVVAPEPVTNAGFTAALGKRLGRPTLATVPEFAVKLALGSEMAEETALVSQRVVPRVLEKLGFHFTHRTIEQALAAELAAA